MGNGKKLRAVLLLLVDMFIVFFAYVVSYYIKYEGTGSNIVNADIFMKHIPIIIGLYILPLVLCRMYRSLWRIAGFEEFLRAGMAVAVGYLLNVIYANTIATEISTILSTLAGLIICVSIIGVRLSYRILRRILLYKTIFLDNTSQKVLIIGAGSCGRLVIDEMQKDTKNNMKPVAIIDDDINKSKTFLRGIKVYGGRDKINLAVKNENIDIILIAIASLTAQDKKEIIEICKDTKKKEIGRAHV